MTRQTHDELYAWCDHVQPVMFGLSIVFLAVLGILLHVGSGVEVMVSVATASTSDLSTVGWESWFVAFLVAGFLATWTETVFWWAVGSRRWKQHLWCCVLPPLRLATRDHVDGTSIWLPSRGWVNVDNTLRNRLERRFGMPMIGIALLVLPLILVEHFWAEQIEASARLQLATSLAAALIWFAFAFEFVLMMSVVDKRFVYCKEHWIDIVVILAPMVAFLRVARLSRVMRLKQLTKTARVFRMRGVLMRTWRALLLLGLVQRLLWGGPERRLRKLRTLLEEKEAEVSQLRQAICDLEAELETVATVEEPLENVA